MDSSRKNRCSFGGRPGPGTSSMRRTSPPQADLPAEMYHVRLPGDYVILNKWFQRGMFGANAKSMIAACARDVNPRWTIAEIEGWIKGEKVSKKSKGGLDTLLSAQITTWNRLHPNPDPSCTREWFDWDRRMERLQKEQDELEGLEPHAQKPPKVGGRQRTGSTSATKDNSRTEPQTPSRPQTQSQPHTKATCSMPRPSCGGNHAERLNSLREYKPAASKLGAQAAPSASGETPTRVGGETRPGVGSGLGRDSQRDRQRDRQRPSWTGGSSNAFDRREPPAPEAACSREQPVERTSTGHENKTSRPSTNNFPRGHVYSLPARTRERAPSPPPPVSLRTPEVPRRTPIPVTNPAPSLDQRPKPAPLSMNRGRQNMNLDTARDRPGTARAPEQVDKDLDIDTYFNGPAKTPAMARKQGFVQKTKDNAVARADEDVNAPRARTKIAVFNDKSQDDKENNMHGRVNPLGSVNNAFKPTTARQREGAAPPGQCFPSHPTETVTRDQYTAPVNHNTTDTAPMATSSVPAHESKVTAPPASSPEPKERTTITEAQKCRVRKAYRRTALTGTKYFFALRGDVVAMQSHRNIAYKRAKVAMKLNASREKRAKRQSKKAQRECKQAQVEMKRLRLNDEGRKIKRETGNEPTDYIMIID
ncbi:hypothetical protein DFH27DRAFT_610214 [Peziza echinospora]|nr:hypothetical protein DFH27DRAFT_610214 [Peziza echinospora]